MVITGMPGSGKTTAMCYVMVKMLEKQGNMRMRYCTLSELAEDWLAAKKDRTERNFEIDLKKNELLVIDELVGRRKESESVNELIFNLVDWASSKKMETKIWLAGNIRSKSFDNLFSKDSDAFKRRINEFFKTFVFHDGAANVPNNKW